MATIQRFLALLMPGCLLGGAVGDALGAPIEFMSRSDILHQLGSDGITQYAPAYGGLGTITDDTQMTLFTAEGLMRGWIQEYMKGHGEYSKNTALAYLRWLVTQGIRPECIMETPDTGGLIQCIALHHRRAPGNTCLSALQTMSFPGEYAIDNSKGCGGVMRFAPVGLFTWGRRQHMSLQSAFQLGADLAALTHGYPTGFLTEGVLAVMIHQLVEGTTMVNAVNAEETLAISVYCALVARDFRESVILAVNHDGDSDSTGAIAGNLLGTLHGVASIPNAWLEPLELRDVITAMADDLHSSPNWHVSDG
ncbi:ADP-ribosylglycohydrolase family protein [Nitrincola tapanii]|uniref:ADP-ribosylglycohydrolase family protein n=1 Tax=Nitrincola tapanii TaxID=1708751 RepID=A0A5A9VYP6_9GAMM|nr:ADP-ribosylglycohydrolase family protein [Nitrincola tapanii]KAA0873513.1 ADP-ribosylglycohydrolase family protein [Nitrincola tapanii]